MRAVNRVTCVGCSYRFVESEEIGTCFRRMAMLAAIVNGGDEHKEFIGTGECWIPSGCLAIWEERE